MGIKGFVKENWFRLIFTIPFIGIGYYFLITVPNIERARNINAKVVNCSEKGERYGEKLKAEIESGYFIRGRNLDDYAYKYNQKRDACFVYFKKTDSCYEDASLGCNYYGEIRNLTTNEVIGEYGWSDNEMMIASREGLKDVADAELKERSDFF